MGVLFLYVHVLIARRAVVLCLIPFFSTLHINLRALGRSALDLLLAVLQHGVALLFGVWIVPAHFDFAYPPAPCREVVGLTQFNRVMTCTVFPLRRACLRQNTSFLPRTLKP